MGILDAILSQPAVYRLWQATHENDKFAPILAHNDLSRVSRVLDVGCGPGTNATNFAKSDYLGIDLNPAYIESAKRRHGGRFLAVDAAKFSPGPGERFDFILVNSFLHHVDTDTTQRILLNLRDLLTPDGHIHILEPVLPGSTSVARLVAKADRGKFVRPLKKWEGIFRELFTQTVLEPFTLRLAGITLWHMVYFKGRAKTA
jgi:SAM-dependent methyltransferase